jgi:hypothetical protein
MVPTELREARPERENQALGLAVPRATADDTPRTRRWFRGGCRGSTGNEILYVSIPCVSIHHPLPHVTRHVEQAEPVAGERTDRRRHLPRVAAFATGYVREVAVEFVAPREEQPIFATPGGILPLDLGRQPAADRIAERARLVPRDVDDRMPVRVPRRLAWGGDLRRFAVPAELLDRDFRRQHVESRCQLNGVGILGVLTPVVESVTVHLKRPGRNPNPSKTGG